MRNPLVLGVGLLIGLLLSGHARADRAEKICRQQILDRTDPWEGNVTIDWDGQAGCKEIARTRMALEQGDPWKLARAGQLTPGDRDPWNFGTDRLLPIPRLLAPQLDVIDPWARLRPAAPSLRWPASEALSFRSLP